jgi:hypothetical protein
LARTDRACALILLGSGPKRLRTMDNPLNFATKAAFIRRKLKEKGFIEGVNFVIQEMTNPTADVSTYILSRLAGVKDHSTQTVNIIHIAGGKDEDSSKLFFVLKNAKNSTQKLLPSAEVSGTVKSINPTASNTGKAMSATQVRIDALKAHLKHNPQLWLVKYTPFYGDNAEAIYNGIIEIITGSVKTQEQWDQEIQAYIASKSGGKKNKTKKRSTRKKRREKRREKRRTTRRK